MIQARWNDNFISQFERSLLPQNQRNKEIIFASFILVTSLFQSKRATPTEEQMAGPGLIRFS